MFTKLADAVADRVIIKLAQLQEYQAQVAAAAELQAQGALQTKTAAYQQAMIKRAAQRKLLKLIKQAGAKEVFFEFNALDVYPDKLYLTNGRTRLRVK